MVAVCYDINSRSDGIRLPGRAGLHALALASRLDDSRTAENFTVGTVLGYCPRCPHSESIELLPVILLQALQTLELDTPVRFQRYLDSDCPGLSYNPATSAVVGDLLSDSTEFVGLGPRQS